jgi:hypothetical protein
MPNGHEIADALAVALAGTVHELPTEDRFDRLVVLADGRVPLVVRDWGHTLGVCLVGVRGWHARPKKFVDALVREIVVAARAWAKSESRERATMFECAAVLVEFLAAHTGGPWTASLPGVVVPAELWLRPREGSASVGVFSDAVRVWVGAEFSSRPVPAEHLIEQVLAARAELGVTSSSMRAIAAAVDEQLAEHARNLDLALRIEAVAERLMTLLEPRLGPGTRSLLALASHFSSIKIDVAFPRGDEIRVYAKDNRVIVEAGLVGEQGWLGSSEAVDDIGGMIDPILDALERARRSLTIERLVVGREYEVRENLQELRTGMIVRFDGFNDIDNHYGRYEFTSRDGRSVAVAGDFSSPRHSPLGEAHRYLKVIG